MKICCLCPVFSVPARLIANSIACFLAQTHTDKELLILDDGAQLDVQEGDGWKVATIRDRALSLPHKYDAMVRWADEFDPPDAFAAWDADDVYLPTHLATAATALDRARNAFWKPAEVYSLCTGKLATEAAAGRFHGSLAVGRDALDMVGGWLGVMPRGKDRSGDRGLLPGDRRADFDQRMIRALRSQCVLAGEDAQPTYVYRWASTKSAHCSGLMRSPDDETWYTRHADAGKNVTWIGRVAPRFDAETVGVYCQLGFKTEEIIA